MERPEHAEILDMDLSAGGDDWQPTPHGRFLAEVLAEHNIVQDREVLELGAGVANHTIVFVRQGAKQLVATEITQARIDTTRENVERNCPQAANVEYRVADWLGTEGQFDVVVTNPPFAKSGQRNRRYFIDSLILDAHKRLKPGGVLSFVQSSMADLGRTQRELERNGFRHEILGETRGAFRDYYFEDETFMREIQEVPNGFEVEDGTHYEHLYVLRAVLEPWSPPDGAH